MDFDFYPDNLNEDDDEDAGNEYTPQRGYDSVIVAVECCEEMFCKTESDDSEGENPFGQICNAVKEMMKHKIISNDKDLQGFVLFGTREMKNPQDSSHVYVMQNLDRPSVGRIDELQQLEDTYADNFDEKYGKGQKNYDTGKLLWCCASMFSGCNVALSSRTLVMFTWNDNPHEGDRNAHIRAKTKANDLMHYDTEIQVLSFNKDFKYEKFYKDIMTDPEEQPPFSENPIDGIKNLYDFLLKKCTKQRPIARISLSLFKGLEMAVTVHTVARRAVKGPTLNLDQRTNAEVQTRTNYVETDTGEILMPSDIVYQQKWAERTVTFEQEEIEAMKKSSTGTGLTLLGFKPKEKAIKPWYHMKPSQFIYPNEKAVKGSSALFEGLLRKCIEKKVVPICKYVARSNSQQRCVALLPQEEELDENTGEQIAPPGFFIIFLPFSDDMRHVEIDRTASRANESQVKAAEAIIKKLKFTYNPENFDNPVLQTHYKNLEAMALDKDEPENIVDHTLPDEERMSRKAGTEISTFKELVFPADYKPGAKPKRKMENSGARASGSKRSNSSEINMKELAEQGKLGRLTVATMKTFCKENGLETTGKKSNLITEIENYFS